MRKRLILILAILVLLSGVALAAWFGYKHFHQTEQPKVTVEKLSTAQKEEVHTKFFGNKIVVLINQTAFIPQHVLIKANSAVEWTNTSTIEHQIVTNDGTTITAASSQVLAPGNSFTFVFKKTGTYIYHDNLHPEMLGTVTVK